MNQYIQENEQLKEALMQLWSKVSKDLNDEFEEIPQMGVPSDPSDIVNALSIIHDARQEQEMLEKNKLKLLEQEVIDLKAQLEQRSSEIISSPNALPEQLTPDLKKELREVKELKQKLQETYDIHQLLDHQRQFMDKYDKVQQIEKKVNELNLQLIEEKLEKVNQITSLQLELNMVKQEKQDVVKELQEKTKLTEEQQQVIDQLQDKYSRSGQSLKGWGSNMLKLKSENVSPDHKLVSDLKPQPQKGETERLQIPQTALSHFRSGSSHGQTQELINKFSKSVIQKVEGSHQSHPHPFSNKKE